MNINERALSLAHLQVKSLKKTLPKSCSFLAVIKTTNKSLTDNGYIVRAIINGSTYHFKTPSNLVYTIEHIEVLRDLIVDKCQQVKSK